MKKCIATFICLFTFVLASMAQLIPNGIYVIRCAGDPSYVMTLKDGKTSNGIVINKWQNKNAQKWRVENVKDGSIIIHSVVNDKYAAHVNSKNVTDNGKVISGIYGGKKNERWIPESNPDCTFRLKLQQDKNLSLDVYEGKYSNNNILQVYSSNGGDNQEFIFQLIKGGTSYKSSSDDGVIAVTESGDGVIATTTTGGTTKPTSGTGSSTKPSNQPFSFDVPKSSSGGSGGKSSSNNSGSKTSSNNTKSSDNTKSGGSDSGNNTKTNNTKTNTQKSSTTQLIPDGVYYIKCAGDPNYVMSLKNGKTTSGNEIVLNKKKNTNAQKWKIENQKDGSIIIRSMVNEKYAANIKSGEVAEWSKLISGLYGGKKNERWIPEKTDNGTFFLRMQQDKNLCLDVLNYAYEDNNPLHIYSFHGDHNQQFIFEKVKDTSSDSGNNTKTTTTKTDNTKTTTTKTDPPKTETTKSNKNQMISDGIYVIKCSGDPSYVLTLEDGKVNNGVVVYKWKNANYQKWKVENQSDGSILIRSMANDKYCMGVKPDDVFDHTRVVGLLSKTQKNERWVPQKSDKGYFFLKLLANKEYFLDVLDFSYFDNNIVQACGYWGDHNQQFIFEKVK